MPQQPIADIQRDVATAARWLRANWIASALPNADARRPWLARSQTVVCAAAVAVAIIGGLSLHWNWPPLAAVGLDWKASQPGAFSAWIYWAWPLLVLLAPMAFVSPAFSVGIYVFAAYSVFGAENAARSLYLGGMLDWLLAIVCASSVLGYWERGEPFFTKYGRYGWLLIACVLWGAICLAAAAASSGPLPPPLYYRQPALWIHCLAIFFLAVRALDSPVKLRSLILLVSLILVWRVELTRSGAWLEGHHASYLAIVLPWLFFSIDSRQEATRSTYWACAGLLIAIAIMKLTGAPHDRIALIRSFVPSPLLWLAAIACFFVPKTRFDIGVRVILTAYLSFTVLNIQNRGAIVAFLAAAACSWVLLNWKAKLLSAAMGLSVAAAAFWLSDVPHLAARFQAALEADRTSGDSAGERLRLWEAGMSMARQFPLLGVGPGQFSNRVREFSPKDIAVEGLDAHNHYIQVLGEMGWPGVVLFSLFWSQMLLVAVLVARRARHPDVLALGKAAACFWVAYSVVGVFGARHDLPLAYLLAGLAVATLHVAETQNENRYEARERVFSA